MRKKVLGLLSALIILTVGTQFAVSGEAQSNTVNTSSLTITKAASVTETDGGNVVFTLRLKNNAQCGLPFNSTLVFDRSASMGYDGENPPQPLTDSKRAAYEFIQALDFSKDKTGLVIYNDKPELITTLTSDPNAIINPLIDIKPSGFTNISDSITLAAQQLRGVQNPVMILFTDGVANRPFPEDTAKQVAITAAANAKSQGIRIVAIGLGKGADLQTLKAIASSSSDFHYAPTTDELRAIFTSLAKSFQGISPNTQIGDDLTGLLTGFDFVSASSGGSFSANKVSWDLGDLVCGEEREVSFVMQPRLCGTNPGDYLNTASAVNGVGERATSNQVGVKLLVPNITISVTDNTSLVRVGQQLDYVVEVANNGDGASQDLSIDFVVADAIDVIAGSISPAGQTISPNVIRWNLRLASGESTRFSLSGVVQDSVADGYSDMVSTVKLSDGCGMREITDTTQVFKQITPDPDYSLVVNCINYDGNKLEAYFGYENRLDSLQPLDKSDLVPSSAQGRAPRTLKPGVHEEEFMVSELGTEPTITWETSVGGQVLSVTADTTSPTCQQDLPNPEIPHYPPTEIVIGGPKVDTPPSLGTNFPPVVSISATTKLPRCESRIIEIDDCSLSDADGVIAAAQFSLNGGKSWYPVREISGLGTAQAKCRIETPSLPDGTYELRVRALDNNGNFGVNMAQNIVVDCEGIVIGSTQFNQRGLLAPINDFGRVQSFMNTDLYMAIAIAGGPDKVEIHTERENTDRVFNLSYNSNLELWEGNLIFTDAGVYNLRVVATESSGQSTTRYTNSVEVIPAARVLDSNASVVSTAKAWIYYRADNNSEWQLWNGGVFGITQPLRADRLEVVLEPGIYYLEVVADGFYTTTTRQFSVNEYSILDSQIQLYRYGDILNWINSITQSVEVSPIGQELIADLQQMIGLPLPEISITIDHETIDTAELLSQNRPFILVTWTDWGTISAAQWQNISDLFSPANQQLLGDTDVYPIGLLEGLEENQVVRSRGGYQFPIYKPADLGFFDIMHVISAPQYYFVDDRGIVRDIKVGTMLPEQVASIAKDINNLVQAQETN